LALNEAQPFYQTYLKPFHLNCIAIEHNNTLITAGISLIRKSFAANLEQIPLRGEPQNFTAEENILAEKKRLTNCTCDPLTQAGSLRLDNNPSPPFSTTESAPNTLIHTHYHVSSNVIAAPRRTGIQPCQLHSSCAGEA